MAIRINCWGAHVPVLVGSILVYFGLYPQDLPAIVSPVEKVLAMSFAVSPWLYGVIGVVVLSWTMVRIWGGKSRSGAGPENLRSTSFF